MRQLDALDVAAELDRGLEGEAPVILLEIWKAQLMLKLLISQKKYFDKLITENWRLKYAISVLIEFVHLCRNKIQKHEGPPVDVVVDHELS